MYSLVYWEVVLAAEKEDVVLYEDVKLYFPIFAVGDSAVWMRFAKVAVGVVATL